jgi:8-hydroxy-5-deazaflavin:NADPH oxidoreductase
MDQIITGPSRNKTWLLMNIAVFGTGMAGQTIAGKLQELDHFVIMGTRDVQKTINRTEKDRRGISFSDWYNERKGKIKIGTYQEAAATSEIIFNCTSGNGSLQALEQAGQNNLKGKILMDVSNPLDFSKGSPPILNPGNTDSLGELLQRTFPSLHVVKTLNTMNCYLMINPSLVPGDHTVFVSGNDSGAKAKVVEILKSFGWKEKNILDLGDITTARGTEQLLPIWVRLWGKLQTPMFNFNIVVAPK